MSVLLSTLDSDVLTNIQQKAYNLIVNDNKNVFLTGPGGVGKSFLIKKIKFDLMSKHCKNAVITSTTGISAQIIGGTTIFSYLGIQLGTKSYDALLLQIKKNILVLSRWKNVEILIIDEVSMMSIELFEKIEKLARAIRKNESPFGGIQIILSGDYLQLPSVTPSDFLFESTIWDTCIDKTIYLTEIVRQSDALFINVLNKVRIGNIDDEVRSILQSREIKYRSVNGLIPTMFFTTNNKVDAANSTYYDKLLGDEFTYKIKYKWAKKIAYKEKYDTLIRFKASVNLKIGAQVMYLINAPKNNLVNGSRGIIKNFIDGFPLVLFDNGTEIVVTYETLDIEERNDIVLSYTQLPLTLAWAITIHRSQGSTISLARIDFKNIFEFGQAYVGLSRVKSIDGLYIRNLDFDSIKTNPKAIKYYKDLEAELKIT